MIYFPLNPKTPGIHFLPSILRVIIILQANITVASSLCLHRWVYIDLKFKVVILSIHLLSYLFTCYRCRNTSLSIRPPLKVALGMWRLARLRSREDVNTPPMERSSIQTSVLLAAFVRVIWSVMDISGSCQPMGQALDEVGQYAVIISVFYLCLLINESLLPIQYVFMPRYS